MILKFKNSHGEWEYVSCDRPVVKKNEDSADVTLNNGAEGYHLMSEAYLLNDHGQTIERLN